MKEYLNVAVEIICFDKTDVVCASKETDNFGEINKSWFDFEG